MNAIEKFENDVRQNISGLSDDDDFRKQSINWVVKANSHRYTYNFTSLGRPVIQFPQDIIAMQELVWLIKPDLVIETGIAHGGSLIASAAALALLDYCEAVKAGTTLDPKASRRRVLAVDIDIRPHNRAAIEAHPLSHMIEMIEGSSIDPTIVDQVAMRSRDFSRVLVSLDSNHTHDHVLSELEAYAPLTSVGSYCVVFDTAIEDMPADMFADRSWGIGNNPKTAVWAYLAQTKDTAGPKFEIDRELEAKLSITVAPDGYLKRTA